MRHFTTNIPSSVMRASTLLVLLLLAACSADGPGLLVMPGQFGIDESRDPLKAFAQKSEALLPQRIRVHPLTHFDRDESSQPQLVCHIELLDQFRHSVKALGRFRIEVYRPDPRGGNDLREGVWTVDLNDPERNAQAYDNFVTRNYVMQLTGLPDWAEGWANDTPASPWIRVDVYFMFSDSTGERLLEESYRVYP